MGLKIYVTFLGRSHVWQVWLEGFKALGCQIYIRAQASPSLGHAGRGADDQRESISQCWQLVTSYTSYRYLVVSWVRFQTIKSRQLVLLVVSSRDACRLLAALLQGMDVSGVVNSIRSC